MEQTSRQMGSSTGVNRFIYVSLQELCALKSCTLQPTDPGQGAAVVVALWCAWTEERKKGHFQVSCNCDLE